MNSKKRAVIGFLILFILVPFLAFSGGQQEPSGQQKADKGNMIAMSLNQEIGTIDPSKTTDWTETMVIVNLYDSLVTPNPDGTMAPLLAKEWSISDDGLEYTFVLHDDAVFHDGSAVIAEDVVFSVERMFALGQGYSWLWADVIDNVVQVNQASVRFLLSKPFSPFLSTLPWLAILNKDLLVQNKADGDFGEYGDYGQEYLLDNDAGSGAYMFKSWERGNQLVFSKFDDYFLGWKDGAIEEVRARVIFSDSTVISEMKTGALDLADHYRSIQTYQKLADMDHIKINEAQSGEALYLKINTQKAPMDNVHVRRAVSWAFDYQTFLEQIDPGASQARGPVPEIINGHNPDVLQYTQNYDKARRELELSGFAPGELTITLVYVEGFDLERKLGLLLQSNLKEIGINLELQPETWGRITDLANNVETTPHMTAVFSAANYPHPDNYLYSSYHSSAAGTWMSMEWLDDPEIDKLIEAGRVAIDKEEQNEIYFEVQERLADQATDVFVYSLLKRYAMNSSLMGLEFVPVMSFEYDFHKMWLE